MRNIADGCGAYLVGDITSYSSLHSANLLESNPFDYCDVVISGTYAGLRGNRGAVIYYRVGEKSNKNS